MNHEEGRGLAAGDKRWEVCLMGAHYIPAEKGECMAAPMPTAAVVANY